MSVRPRGFVAVSTAGSQKKRSLAPALQVTIGTGQRCPFCHEHLQAGGAGDDDALVACAECLTVSHEECVAEGGGGCTTMGCAHSRPEAIARASAHSAPAPAPAAPAQRTSRALPAAAAALVAALAGVGLVLIKPPTVIEPPVVQPAPPRISSFDVHVRGDVLVVRAQGHATRTPGNAHLGHPEARVNGVLVPSASIGSLDGTSSWQVDVELPLEQVVGDRPGSHPVELRFSAWGDSAAAQRLVRVEPRVEPVPPVREVIVVTPPQLVTQGPKLTLDTPVVRTNQTEVEVSGFVDSDGPVQVTIGDLTLQLPPGRFQTTVTVGPRPGTYPIGVRVRDARGRLATAEQRVEFVGDGR
jgi:hypothetical protein